ncbi:hypothetical protein CN918_31900 [Priestia megaterium]|nr:hypothetical protein CN918_31900 [Priestia megaterium]
MKKVLTIAAIAILACVTISLAVFALSVVTFLLSVLLKVAVVAAILYVGYKAATHVAKAK